jgi:nitrogen PTS system EIIA component
MTPGAMAAVPAGERGERSQSSQSALAIPRWLDPRDVQLDVELGSRRHALEVAAETIARLHGIEREPVLRALWRRELVGSTALGCGVAIPHARIDGIPEPTVLYLRAKTAIEFAAPDGKPVCHVLAIAVPSNGDAEAHLELLAAIASMMTERALRERLAAAEDAETIRRAFAEFALAAGAAAP